MADHSIGHRNRALAAASLFANAVRALAQALEARDAYTGGHSARVTLYALRMAQELGLSPAERRELKLAAELHDVGKIGVPDEVLLKPGLLSPEEQRRVQAHPVIGEHILRPLLSDHPTVLAVVRWHHERMDGRGYPDGLRGEEIPFAARIVAVADSFDAMTSARPYRTALPLPVVVAELERNAGTQFDADCVRALLLALARDLSLIPGEPIQRNRRALPHFQPGSERARGEVPLPASPQRWGSVPMIGLLAAPLLESPWVSGSSLTPGPRFYPTGCAPPVPGWEQGRWEFDVPGTAVVRDGPGWHEATHGLRSVAPS